MALFDMQIYETAEPTPITEADDDARLPAPHPDADIAIRVCGIGKMYRIYDRPQDRLKQMLFWRFGRSYGREFWALRDVSFEVRKGETVGIIGRNGSGKSTLLQIIAGTLAPSEGEVRVNGRVAALLELGSGFNPEFTGRENVYLNGAILGLSRDEIDARFDDIAAFADIGEFIDQPVKLYSSGMVVRLAFAVQSHVAPDILIVDEALAVGDIAFQTRCLERIKQLTERGVTIVFVTHDIATFQNLCTYGYLLHNGVLFSSGRPVHIAMQYYELMRESEHARQRMVASSPDNATQVQDELHRREDEIKRKTDAGEYRFGTGEAKIVDYCVLDTEGRETSTLYVGKPFRVVTTVEFYDHVENIAIGIMFRNAQGQNLMGMHSYVEHRVNFGPHDAGDRLEIGCEQTMLLNPGDYLLHISIADCRSDYDFTSLDYRNNLMKVTVAGKPLGYGLIHTTPLFWAGGRTPAQTWQSMAWKSWQEWTLERCRTLAPHARCILEIGGQGAELAPFLAEGDRRLTTLNFPTGDICRPTPYPDGAFDLIVCKMTFEHLYDPFAAAAEITRLLTPGGVLLLSTVWSWRYHTASGYDDYWRFSTAGLAQLFPRLSIIETGYDLEDRRKDCHLDGVPVDQLGGWHEHQYVYLVARKPLLDIHAATAEAVYRFPRCVLEYTLDDVKRTYEAILATPELQPRIEEIIRHKNEETTTLRIASGVDEERAWPGDSRFTAIGYDRMMLGRYAFAGAMFCRGAEVLDTGCGLGWGALLIAHFARRVTAFDRDPRLESFCRAIWPAENITWRTGDMRDMSFLGDERYDVVLGMEVVEHFTREDGERYLGEVAKVLRPGGVFVATSAFPTRADEAQVMAAINQHHLHIFTHDEMLDLLRRRFSNAAIIGNWMIIAVK
jgi:lipopolysaccharide transport system ATP-binding protein